MKAGSFGPKPQKNTLPRDPAGCRGGCLELAGTKDLDLREGGEGGRVIGLDELIELQAGDDYAVQVEQLALGGLGERQDALFAGGKGQAGLCPPCVVWEVGAGGQEQRFGADRTPKVQLPTGVGVAVDAPALKRIPPVTAGIDHAVDGVAGREHGFAPRFHIGLCVGETAGVVVVVVAVAPTPAAFRKERREMNFDIMFSPSINFIRKLRVRRAAVLAAPPLMALVYQCERVMKIG